MTQSANSDQQDHAPKVGITSAALDTAFLHGLADPARLGLFEAMMLEGQVYAVSTGSAGEAGQKQLEAGEQLSLRGVTLSDGREAFALFTDPRRAVQAFGEDVQVIGMQGRVLLGMLTSRPLLFNPDGKSGLVMSRERVAQLLGANPS